MRCVPLLALYFVIALGSAKGLSAQDGQPDGLSSEAPTLEACEARVAGLQLRAEVDRRKVNALISARDALQSQLDNCAVDTVPDAEFDRTNALLDALEARLTEIEQSLE